MMSSPATGRILVLYGSQTYTAQEIAERIWRSTKVLGFRGPVAAMDDYLISKLIYEEFAIFVCSTTGQGDQPDNMKRFWNFLLRRNLPPNSLEKLMFGVLGLGDSSYPKFNYAGKLLYKRLLQLGATPLLDIGLCDYQHDLGHDAVMIPWLKNYFTRLQRYFPSIKIENLSTKFVPRWEVSILKEDHNLSIDGISDDMYFSKGRRDILIDSKLFEIVRNDRTTHESHFQDVRLMTLKETEGYKLEYKPGDIVNIRPRNSKEDIEDLFSIFETHSIDIKPHYNLLVEKYYDDMSVPYFLKTPLTMYEIAEQYWDLKAYPTQYVFSLLAMISEDKLERDKCIELSSPEGQEDWLNYCRRPRRTILEVLHDFHKSASKLTIKYLFELFSTIKPRSFSIASSCLPSNGQKLDILVAVVNYNTKLNKPRLGLASNWLASLGVGDRVYGWIQKGSLDFPEPTTPHILVGPGTGLAPFRSLIQEYEFKGTLDKHNIHLFIGCRYKEKDFHCRKELEKLVDEEKLSLYCAFSRDQENKVYVQHKIIEHGDTIWSLIGDKQAHIYISGNSKNMPDNVKDAFVDVFAQKGKISTEIAKELLEDMEGKGQLQVEAW